MCFGQVLPVLNTEGRYGESTLKLIKPKARSV